MSKRGLKQLEHRLDNAAQRIREIQGDAVEINSEQLEELELYGPLQDIIDELQGMKQHVREQIEK